MARLKYIKGDATDPQRDDDDLIVIPHIVNDCGLWGSGFVIGVSKRWPHVRDRYLQQHKEGQLLLGDTDFVKAEDGIIIANMVGQVQPGGINGRAPIRYGALASCMYMVKEFICVDEAPTASIHTPMFGSARAGGNFEVIEAMILEIWVDNGIDVIIYQYEE